MKIVCKDNFDRETRSDRLVAENVGSKREGDTMLEALRRAAGHDEWYVLVEDDYVLYEFKP